MTYATVDAAADGRLLHTASQRRFAAFATTATFVGVLVLLCAVPTIVLATTATADVRFAGLDEAVATGDDGTRAQCLRAARRSDYVVAFLGIGAPVQHLQLLLRLDEVVASPDEALYVFTSRLLKSQTIACESAAADSTLVARCTDVALVYDGADEQRHLQTSFQFSNPEVAESRHARAYELRLDGELRLSLGHTVWLTTTHLCWAEHGAFPPVAGAEDTVLPLARVYDSDETDAHWLSSAAANVAVFEPFAKTPIAAAFHGADTGCYETSTEPVRVFPLAAYNEYAEWLVLGAQFTFEYSTDTLADRRTVIEVGSECASLLAKNSTRLARASACTPSTCCRATSTRARRTPPCPSAALPITSCGWTLTATASTSNCAPSRRAYSRDCAPAALDEYSSRRSAGWWCCSSPLRWCLCVGRSGPPTPCGCSPR